MVLASAPAHPPAASEVTIIIVFESCGFWPRDDEDPTPSAGAAPSLPIALGKEGADPLDGDTSMAAVLLKALLPLLLRLEEDSELDGGGVRLICWGAGQGEEEADTPTPATSPASIAGRVTGGANMH